MINPFNCLKLRKVIPESISLKTNKNNMEIMNYTFKCLFEKKTYSVPHSHKRN